jgi:hypothetical protein
MDVANFKMAVTPLFSGKNTNFADSTQEKSKEKISLLYLKIPFLNFHCSLLEEEKSVGRGHRGTPLPWARSAAMSGVSQRLQAWRLPEAAAAAWWGQPQWPLGWL